MDQTQKHATYITIVFLLLLIGCAKYRFNILEYNITIFQKLLGVHTNHLVIFDYQPSAD